MTSSSAGRRAALSYFADGFTRAQSLSDRRGPQQGGGGASQPGKWTVPQEARGLGHPEGQKAMGRPTSGQRLQAWKQVGGGLGPPAGLLYSGTRIHIHLWSELLRKG